MLIEKKLNADDLIISVFVQVTGNIATWQISGSNGTTTFTFTPFTTPLTVNVIEDCP